MPRGVAGCADHGVRCREPVVSGCRCEQRRKVQEPAIEVGVFGGYVGCLGHGGCVCGVSCCRGQGAARLRENPRWILATCPAYILGVASNIRARSQRILGLSRVCEI